MSTTKEEAAKSPANKLITADELWGMGDIGRCELIYGELVMMSPASFGHGEVAVRLAYFIFKFVKAEDLGAVTAAETGYFVDTDPESDLVRAPDVGFVRRERLEGVPLDKFFRGAPDLAVEVVSPSESKREVFEKVNMWLVAGATSAWVADPRKKTVAIHRVGKPVEILNVGESIKNEPLLPGFVLPVDDIFGL